MADEKPKSRLSAAFQKFGKAAAEKASKARDQARATIEEVNNAPTGEAREKVKIEISPEKRAKNSKRRLMLIAVGVFGTLIVLVSLTKKQPPPPAPEEQPKNNTIELMPSDALRQTFEQQTQNSIRDLQRQMLESQNAQKVTDKAIQEIQSQQNKVSTAIDGINDTLARIEGKVASGSSGAVPPPPQQLNGRTLPQAPPAVPPPPLPGQGGAESSSGATSASPAPTPVETAPIVIKPDQVSADGRKNEKVGAYSGFVPNSNAGLLPPGSFMPAVLLTGIEAGTAETSQGDPQPVLMRLEQPAMLPGAARYQIRSCFALGASHGSLSTERAYVRLATLSCMDKDRKLVLSADLKGYVADSDGLFGLRGVVIHREGALLAKTLLAGFAGGLATALGQAQGTTTIGTFGGATQFSGSDALRTAGFSGAASATNKLAEFYLKQAESIFPVIEVDPKRKATVVVTEGTPLKWADYGALYVKQTVPDGKQQ
ncbi:MAG: TraB/VirB10 family protein [Sinobacteraceae bacterium]|nr:TraB/VirB10 family protein [Nevskiaceae bacterium]